MKHSHVPLQIHALTRSSTYTRVKQTVWEDSGLCVRTHTHIQNIHVPYILLTLCCPSAFFAHTYALKNHHLEYKAYLLGGLHNAVLTSGLPNHFHKSCPSTDVCKCVCVPCSRVCVCARASVCVSGAPPDYSCSIINSDQICFVA